MREAPDVGSETPWGRVDFARDIGPGVVSVSTPSHGGIWVSLRLEALIRADCRAVARQYAPPGWYEEDCDAVIPLALLPGVPPQLAAEARVYARQMGDRMAPLQAELLRRNL